MMPCIDASIIPLFIESEEISDGIILDCNADGKVVGIEVLYVSQRSPSS